MKNIASNWVKYRRHAAIAGCLLVLTAANMSWGQLVFNTEDGDALANWTQYNATGTVVNNYWAITNNVAKPSDGPSFLIRKDDISSNGDFTAKLTTDGANTWAFKNGWIVFRYTSPSAYYAIMPNHSNGTQFSAFKLVRRSSTTNDTTDFGGAFSVSNGNPVTLEMTVKLRGDTINVYVGNASTPIYTRIDNLNKSGKVGYFFVENQHNRHNNFLASSWTNSCSPTASIPNYSGYRVWNTVAGPTYRGGAGSWAGTFWSGVDRSPCNLTTWVDRQNALFHAAPGGAVTVAGNVLVPNMVFSTSGYAINGTGTLSSSGTAGSTDTITVTGTNTATIEAVLGNLESGNNRRNIVKSGTGTLTLSGTNTYRGTTTIGAGKLTATRVAALGILDGGTNTAITNNGELEFSFATGVVDTLKKIITGTGTLIKSGNGELVFSGAATGTAGNKAVGTLNVTGGTLSIPAEAAVTVSTSFTVSGAATALKVGIGNTLGAPTTLSLGGILNITGTLPDEEKTYTLFGGTATPVGTFATVQVNGTAWTRAGTATPAKYYSAGGADTVSINYAAGVKYTFKPKGGTTLTEYTITFNLNYEGAPIATTLKTGTNGRLAALPANPTRTGYTFDNWYTVSAATGGVQVTTSTVFNRDSTVYARWTQATSGTFTITFDANGGTVSQANASTRADSTLASFPPDPVQDGCSFLGWYTAAAGGTEVPADRKYTANTTIYAQWNCTKEPGTFVLTVRVLPSSVYGSALPDPIRPGGVYDSGAVVTLTATPGDGYTFTGWSLDGGATNESLDNPYTITMDANKTVTAVFGGDGPPPDTKYTLVATAEPSDGGSIEWSNGAPGQQYDPNHVVTLTAVAKGSWSFSYWEVDGANMGKDNPYKVTMNGNKVVKAIFEVEMEKLISIESAEYIDSSMTFRIVLSPEKAFSGVYTYELMYDGDTVVSSKSPVGVSGSVGTPIVITTPMVGDIQFNSRYTIFVRILNAGGTTQLSSTVSENIDVGDFKVQIVTGVGAGASAENNTVYADNERFRLGTEGWEGNSNLTGSKVSVTVSEALGLEVSADFIVLSKDYKFSVLLSGGTAMTFNVPFVVGIEVEAGKLPSGYGAEDARLYRYVNGNWEVLFDSDTATYDGNVYVSGKGRQPISTADTGAYRLMINTKTPTVQIGGVTFSDGAARKSGYFKNLATRPILPGSDRIEVDKVVIGSNVVNTRAGVVYAAANVSSVSGLTALKDTLIIGGNTPNVITISADLIETGNVSGVLVYLIVDNGSVSDTVNLSHNVKLNSYATATRDYHKRWAPMYAKVNLADSTIEKVFKESLFTEEDEVGDGLPSDPMKYRLFRWLPKVQGAESSGWMEYRDDRKQHFSLVNGRLMWLRTASNVGNFKFGVSATTTPLTDTFTVRDTLKSRQWTDLVLPFDFKVKVRDILAATVGEEKSDSLYFYTWEQDNNGNFAAKRLYVWNTDNADTALDGPFTVYNNMGRNVMLRIPPKPAFLSSSKGAGGMAKAQARMSAGSGFWYYAISAATDDVSNLASLRLGYYDTERAAPAPPTLGSRSVVILSDDGWQMGDYLTPELAKSGRTFKLRFVNGDRQKAVFKFSAEASAGVPERMQLMFVDAVTGEVLGGSSSERSITVAANAHADVYAVMGSRDYLNKTAVGPSGAKFAMGGVSVNQAARSVRVKYYVPLAGTDRVEVSVYNLKGRLVWKNAERVRQSSWNTMEWRARESRGGAAAAGLYIIRIRAMNVNGKTTAVENRKITFAR